MDRLSTLTEQQFRQTAVADCMRLLSCHAATRGAPISAARLFLERYPRAVHAAVIRKSLDDLTTKAAVAAGSTTDATWAGALVMPAAFVDPLTLLVQQKSLLGRIVGLREVPFNTPVPLQTTGASFGWVGERQVKPISKFGFDDVVLPPGKVQGTVTLTAELVKLAQPSSVGVMRDQLVAGSAEFLDRQLLDPAVTEIATIRPASLTADVVATPSTGDLQADIASLLSALYASRPSAARPTLVMHPTQAGVLAASGLHPDLTVSGGTAFGVPVVTSTGADLHIVALDASAIAYAGGDVLPSVTTEASLDMNDAPGAPTAATVQTSLWQLNLVAIRVERPAWWAKVPGSVQLLTVPAATAAATRRPAGKAAVR